MDGLGFAILLELIFGIGQFFFVNLIISRAVTKIEAGKGDNQIDLFFVTIAFALLNTIPFAYIIGFGWAFGYLLYPAAVSAAVFALLKGIDLKPRDATFIHIKQRERRSLIPYYLLSYILLPLACIAPLFTGNLVIKQCDSFHRNNGNIIFQAIQRYELENGQKPDNLNALMPKYISKIPGATCYTPLRWVGIQPQFYAPLQNDYMIVTCAEGLKVLVVEDMNHSQPQVLNLNNAKWSYSVGDTLDDSLEKRICQGAGGYK